MFRSNTFRARLAQLSARSRSGLHPPRLWALIAGWASANRTIVVNAGALIGTTAATSGLGFIYWWLAARMYPETEVGFAAAAVSAMSLLGTFGMMGFGTLLMGEVPRQPGREISLISTALTVAGIVSAVLGALAALAAPMLAADLRPLGASAGGVALFTLGVSLSAMTLVLDQALVGMLRGGLQLGRNVVFAVAKLVALAVAAAWFGQRSGLAVLATWVLGIALSFVVVAWLRAGEQRESWRPDWSLLRGLRRAALGHHALNLALLAPGMLLPLLVTALLSAKLNASYYAAWMIANLVYIGPASLSMVLYAVGASDTALLAQKTRFTLRLATIGGLLAVIVLQFGADWMLHLFRDSYAEQAGWSLRILGVGVFPLIIKDHYVAINRVRGRVAPAAMLIGGLGVFELIVAAFGARIGGLNGLSLGWVVAMCIGTLVMVRTVHTTATAGQ